MVSPVRVENWWMRGSVMVWVVFMDSGGVVAGVKDEKLSLGWVNNGSGLSMFIVAKGLNI